MRKYNICIAVFITLLLSACGNMAELTGETDSSFDVSESAWQEQIEPTQELVEKTEDTITEEDMQEATEITVTQKGKLREDMPEFTFALTAFYDLQTESYALQTVDVYQGDALLQTISIPQLTLFGQTCIDDSLQDTLGFELEDLNFDGYLDMRLFDTLNGIYRTEWVYLVWYPAEQQFEHDARLNEISLATFDQEEQLIYGLERRGAANHYYSPSIY